MDGRELVLTNLEKIMYPETGTTKADVLAYYAAVAPVLIPAARNRPATRKRWVHGVGTADAPGEMFFQKNLDHSTPGWVPRAAITHKDRAIQYPLVNDPATLTWLAQIAALEIHVPQWRVDSHGNAMPPDRLVLDLDPGEGAGLAECVEVAKLARTILQDVGLDPVPVTSGSKGIHLYAALDGSESSDQISEFAHELARSLEADHPDLAVSDMKKTLRTGKVLVDWSQNNAAKTTIVPYSLRGRLRPTVAAPRTWRELSSPSLHHLDFQEVMTRVAAGKDPFAPVSGGWHGAGAATAHTADHGADRLPGGRAETSPEQAGDGGDTDPRLEKYRTKRDRAGTPEPFTAERHHAADDGGTRQEKFVIQEHHASRLHYDFRLERDGVMVSWALPKGVPTSKAKNHLAVQTEDHPMDYADFEGVIPKGQYGAGTVSIWDRGYYECEKWVAGKEVIATLTGAEDGGLGGPRRFALIHTGQADDQWLIHLMDPAGSKARPGGRRPSGTADDADEDSEGDEGDEGDDDGQVESEGEGAAETGTRTGTGTGTEPVPDASGFSPMLATSGTLADLPDLDWQIELKWDGVRALVIGDATKIRLISRNGIDMSVTYPELTDRSRWPEQGFVADGEIIAVGRSGRPDFGLLQGRMKLSKAADVARAQESTPVRLMLFDLLFDAGQDLRRLPLSERRRRLEQFFRPSAGPVELSGVIDGDAAHVLESVAELGLEGVMAKRTDGRYVGQRSRSWLKLKVERTQEVVVGGWRPGRGGRRESVGSLLLGIPDGSKLRYVGRVGSGFSTRELTELRQQLDALPRKTSPFRDVPDADAADANWVSAKLVGEVTFGEWTGSGKLRHPVWRGWRLDKTPADVVVDPAAGR
ncbi:ATP-dependent DNA ligase LigD ligase module /ATP-dependent DNA ligase LigD phosphoesterase module /ATP-dependent DNA ligase LigD polymerase module [Arthrobacter sp. ov407]|nr:ATP-dependent DNA ligase LigD ligase module /ATP-dependent DNA ligase LigD phosphoesterase module /ATP-dependent DNA ligase LigD polymerase module [Arthrobacter sp. ov407]